MTKYILSAFVSNRNNPYAQYGAFDPEFEDNPSVTYTLEFWKSLTDAQKRIHLNNIVDEAAGDIINIWVEAYEETPDGVTDPALVETYRWVSDAVLASQNWGHQAWRDGIFELNGYKIVTNTIRNLKVGTPHTFFFDKENNMWVNDENVFDETRIIYATMEEAEQDLVVAKVKFNAEFQSATEPKIVSI